jgi:hypothetical protein
MVGRSAVSGVVLAIALNWYSQGWAEDLGGTVERFRQQGYSVKTITPIFSQLLMTGSPQGFVPASEKTKPQFYIREAVPKGETVDNWTQMITVTGMKGMTSNPQATPKAVLNNMAGGFKRACPNSFNAQIMSESPIGGFDAAVAVVSCGVSPTTAGRTSETALIAVIKGQADFYTVQWAERTEPSNVPLPIDLKKWTDRFKTLGPVRLCPIVPGEQAPYRSCVGDGFKQPT